MSKLIGKIGWELQPGYPELSGEDGAESITEKYVVNRNAIDQILPPGASYYNEIHPFFNGFPTLRLRSRTVKVMSGAKTYEVTYVWSVPPGLEPPGDLPVYESVEYDTREFSAPLSQHKNYRTRWTHHLIAKKTESSTPPWYLNATTTKIPKDAAGRYVWAKPDDKVPDDWYTLKEAEKTATSFLTGVAVVTHTYRSASKLKLQKKIAEDYRRGSPVETFGATGEWLRGGSKLRKEGSCWVQTVTYTNSQLVDNDLYD